MNKEKEKEKEKPPRKWRKLSKSLLKSILFGMLVILLYFAIIAVFFQTPKASHWIDDATYGNTKYFHFTSGKDAWNESLPIEPPQKAEASYRLAIVELDEFGDFFQSERNPERPEDYQLSCAKEMLLKAGSTDQKPLFLFLFVHGWQHDASREDETLKAFKGLLGHIAQNDWKSDDFNIRDFSICGIYVGWRGASVKHRGWFTRPAELLSFWQRKSVAQKIASTSTSTAIFGLIDTARRAAPHPQSKPSRIVLAGHSLGAGILMNSVSQALAYEYARANSAKSDADAPVILDSPANLILLLNPAVESVYLRQLRESMQPVDWKGYPWLISLTSETDHVTKYLFPLAHKVRFGSNARQPPYLEADWSHYKASTDSKTPGASRPVLRPVSQNVYATETPGHNAYMRDLRLAVRTNSIDVVEKLKKNYPKYDDVIAYNTAYGSHKYFLLKSEDAWRRYGYFDHVRPTNEIHPLFWVATVDRMIMDGHGLPFADGVRRTNFVGTVMTILSHSRVQHNKTASKAEIRTTKARMATPSAPLDRRR